MPRSKEQFEKIKSQRRQEIIECATFIFATTNYDNVAIDDITSKLGISHGLFYHYFKNKNDIFQEVLDVSFRKILDMAKDNNIKNYEPAIKIKLSIEKIIDILKNGTDYEVSVLYLFFNVRIQARTTPHVKKYLEKGVELSNKFNEIIKKAKANETGSDLLDIIICLTAMLKGLLYNRLYTGKEKFICTKAESILKMLGITYE